MPIPGTVRASLIITCVPGTDTDDTLDYEDHVQVDVYNFIVVPVGTEIEMVDGEEYFFDDAEVESYRLTYKHGLLVMVTVTQREWEKIRRAAVRHKGYTNYIYPRALPMIKD